MSVLNIAETESLHHAVVMLQGILREGYDPKDESAQGRLRTREVSKALDSVKTVLSMKGYYPS